MLGGILLHRYVLKVVCAISGQVSQLEREAVTHADDRDRLSDDLAGVQAQICWTMNSIVYSTWHKPLSAMQHL